MKQELKDEIISRENENEVLVDQLEKSLLYDQELINLKQYKDTNQQYIEGLNKVIELGFSENIDAGYAAYLDGVKDKRERANSYMKDIELYLEQYADNLNAEITESNQVSTSIIIAVFIISLVLEMIIGLIIVRMIVNPIKDIQALMENAENGDLTVYGKYISNDELGQLTISFNQMMQRLRELMQQVNVISEQVAASSEELTASAEQTTQATNEITTSIQEVANGAEIQGQGATESSQAINEMAIGIQRVAESTSTVSELALETNKGANSGFEALERVIQQMDTINSAVNNSASVVKDLRYSSEQIGEITEVITSIAAQTNLLALNAAIEAARAGEHGQGFAVVADEVRKLAEQSKESADQITELIKKIQGDTSHAVGVMDKGTQEVKVGVNVVLEAEEGFKIILQNIEHVTAQIQEASAVSEEMSAGVEQVNASIGEIARISQVSAGNTQNVASASEEQLASMEEITSSAAALSKMAEELQAHVSQFKL